LGGLCSPFESRTDDSAITAATTIHTISARRIAMFYHSRWTLEAQLAFERPEGRQPTIAL
jgi:hypothetical protein